MFIVCRRFTVLVADPGRFHHQISTLPGRLFLVPGTTLPETFPLALPGSALHSLGARAPYFLNVCGVVVAELHETALLFGLTAV